MKTLPNGIEFCIGLGTSATQQKREQGFTDRSAIDIFKTALWYAQHDGDGDHRFDPSENERHDFRVWAQLSRRALAGIVELPLQSPTFSVQTRLTYAQELGGLLVLSEEVPILRDMVDWLPGRVDRISSDGAPPYATLHRTMQPLVLSSLRTAQPYVTDMALAI
jgi:hypothetical protein